MQTPQQASSSYISAPNGGLKPVIANAFDGMPEIAHGFFTRDGGVSEGLYRGLNAGLGSDDVRERVIENRRRMAQFLGGTGDDITSPYQVHSADVVHVSSAFDHNGAQARPKADGVVTATPGLPIGIVTADCGPVLFADAKAKVVGAAHAGWKGALTGVLENTIAAMEQLGASRTSITAVLGPMISQASYEVGPDFPKAFIDQSQDNAQYFIPSDREKHLRFDLAGYIADQLTQANVSASSVGHCTYKNEQQFYSYRRTTHRSEPDYGRQMSAIMLTV